MGGQSPAAAPILNTASVFKHFGEVHAVDGVDLHISPGEVLSIVGPNGAGKTTLLKLLSGGHELDRGQVFFLGEDISRVSLVQRVNRGIVYSFQIPALFENLTALEAVGLVLLARRKKTVVFFPVMEKFTEIRQEAQEVLKMFNVPEDFPANLLPHGQRKLLDAAMAFAYRPKLLLLDEPTSGVSTAEKAKVMDTIMPNIEKSNTTTVIVEHDMEIVLRYSRRVIVMDQGKIFAQGIPQEVMEDPKVREVLLGIPASAKT
jgi:branched-chain amino acid transport system ATP-binding protein